MAAGLTVERANLGRLRHFFEEKGEAAVRDLVSVQTLKIDGALGASGANLALIDQLELAGPYGSGHAQPVFALPGHRLRDARQVGINHVKVTLEGLDGSRLEGIAFRALETPLGDFLLSSRGLSIHVAGSISADLWQGSRRVQLRVVDAARAL